MLSLQPLLGTTFHELDTAKTIYSTFSNKFQNRIMLDGGKIKKIISSNEDRLSILLDPLSGQAFIYLLDPDTLNTSLSAVTEEGVVQDIEISFENCSSEALILKQEESPPAEQSKVVKNDVMETVSDILLGLIPEGYTPCSVPCQKWQLKKGIEIKLITKLQGLQEDIYVYQACNNSSKKQNLMECELQFSGSKWVFLETNNLSPKQKILSLVAVNNDE